MNGLALLIQLVSQFAESGPFEGLEASWKNLKEDILTYTGVCQNLSNDAHNISRILPDVMKRTAQDPARMLGGGLSIDQQRRQATIRGRQILFVKMQDNLNITLGALRARQIEIANKIMYLKQHLKEKEGEEARMLMVMDEQTALLLKEQEARLNILENHLVEMNKLYEAYESLTLQYYEALAPIQQRKATITETLAKNEEDIESLEKQIAQKENELEALEAQNDTLTKQIRETETLLENHEKEARIHEAMIHTTKEEHPKEKQLFYDLDTILSNMSKINAIEKDFIDKTYRLDNQIGRLRAADEFLSGYMLLELNQIGVFDAEGKDLEALCEMMNKNTDYHKANIKAHLEPLKAFGVKGEPYTPDSLLKDLNRIQEFENQFLMLQRDKELKIEFQIVPSGYHISSEDKQRILDKYGKVFEAKYGDAEKFLEMLLNSPPNNALNVLGPPNNAELSTWIANKQETIRQNRLQHEHDVKHQLLAIRHLHVDPDSDMRAVFMSTRAQLDKPFTETLQSLNEKIEKEDQKIQSLSLDRAKIATESAELKGAIQANQSALDKIQGTIADLQHDLNHLNRTKKLHDTSILKLNGLLEEHRKHLKQKQLEQTALKQEYKNLELAEQKLTKQYQDDVAAIEKKKQILELKTEEALARLEGRNDMADKIKAKAEALEHPQQVKPKGQGTLLYQHGAPPQSKIKVDDLGGPIKKHKPS